ncbi:hypothetical protein HYN48_12790 [Flavobacterium magnum]|uniref:Uncharacterized protein n=1 Tax=Flavobacterium magnum TaxID=2162713 RepID=A0A2S0RGU1_9FLAO|nr:hypothetical protein HYN48_12790 [Flavobacterium magnum]
MLLADINWIDCRKLTVFFWMLQATRQVMGSGFQSGIKSLPRISGVPLVPRVGLSAVSFYFPALHSVK